MSTEIIVAILALVGTLAGSYFSNNKNTAVINEKIKDLKEYIQILSNRVDRHNNLISRMSVAEEKIKELENISMLLYWICNKNKFRFYT